MMDDGSPVIHSAFLLGYIAPCNHGKSPGGGTPLSPVTSGFTRHGGTSGANSRRQYGNHQVWGTAVWDKPT